MPSQRRELANKLLGNVLTLSLQMYGCRVIQKVRALQPQFLSNEVFLLYNSVTILPMSSLVAKAVSFLFRSDVSFFSPSASMYSLCTCFTPVTPKQ